MLRQFLRLYSTKCNNYSIKPELPNRSDVVIIGAGITGLSTAYYLRELGYNSVVVLERSEPTSGTTWHSNGLVWRLRPSEIDIELLSETHGLVSRRLRTDDNVHTTGWINNGGLFLAHNSERMKEYRRLRALSKYFGIESTILDRNEVIELLHPLIDSKASDLVGGLYSPGDGFVDPTMYCEALIRAARLRVFRNCELVAINTSQCVGVSQQRKINSVTVRADGKHEQIKTNNVVNSSGVWAPNIAKLAGILNTPQETIEHAYVMTDSIDGVSPLSTPNIRDHDLSIALRVSGNSFCIGGYEADPVIISHTVDTIRPFTLFELNWDKFGIHVENAIKLFPVLAQTGIKSTTCGPESFTPDHKPLLGEDINVRGFYYASGFNSFGISLSAGCGLQLAKWIVTGKPGIDMSAYDIRRFNQTLIANREWCRQRCHEAYARNYDIVYNNDEPICARDQTHKDELFDELLGYGCVYEERHGTQRAAWFDSLKPRLTDEEYRKLDHTFDWRPHSRQWIAIRRECESCRQSVAVFNLSSMAKFVVSGKNAYRVIDALCPTNVSSMTNHSSLVTCFLNANAGVEAELILHKLADHQYYITCSDVSANNVMTAIRNYMSDSGVQDVEAIDVSKQFGVIAIYGPNSGEVVNDCFGIDFTPLPLMTHHRIDIEQNMRFRLVRCPQVSDMGCELHIESDLLRKAFSVIMSHRLASNAGLRAYESLKTDRGWLSWGVDYRCDDPVVDTALKSLICPIKLQNQTFIGAQRLKQTTQERHYVSMAIDNKSVMVSGLEPIWHESHIIGLVRRGYYSPAFDQPLALGYISDQHFKSSARSEPPIGASLAIEISGQLESVRVNHVFHTYPQS